MSKPTNAAHPAGPDLRAMVLAMVEALALAKSMILSGEKMSASAEVRIDAAIAAALKAATEPKAGEWRGPWKCDRCSREFHKPLALHYPGNITTFGLSTAEFCTGTLVPYERRKGGEG